MSEVRAGPPAGQAPDESPRRSPARLIWWWLALAVVAAIVVLLVFPTQLHVADSWPVALIISFRTLLGITWGVLAALLLVFAIASRPGRRWRIAAYALVFALGAGGQWAVQSSRLAVATTSAGASQSVRLLSFNTNATTTPAQLTQLISGADADIAVLPGVSALEANQVAAGLRGDGVDMQVFALTSRSSSALLIDRRLGTYTLAERAPTLQPSFVVTRGTDGSGPVAVALVHTVRPVHPGMVDEWRAETEWAVNACNEYPGAVIAGDFNATIDHPALANLGHCVDAGVAAGLDARGTWPTWLPPALAAPFDHVLADGRTWWVASFSLQPNTGASEHRPVLAVLSSRVPS